MKRRECGGRQIIYLCGTTAVDDDAPHLQSEACDWIDALQRDLAKWKETVTALQDVYEKAEIAAYLREEKEQT